MVFKETEHCVNIDVWLRIHCYEDPSQNDQRMMGIMINGSTYTFCDNESVVKNTMKSESTLKKKHNAIAYHHVHEAQAAGVVHIAHKDGETNLADVLTKSLPGPRLHELISYILY